MMIFCGVNRPRLAGLKPVLLLLMAISGLGASQASWAYGTALDCTYTNGYYIFGSTTTIRVKPNTAVGSPIGGWVNITSNNDWPCRILSTHQNDVIMAGVDVFSPYTIATTANIDGTTYNVFNSVVKAGLGYVARFRVTGAGFASNWMTMNGYSIANAVRSSPLLGPIPYNNGATFNLGFEIQIHFVKTTTGLVAGSASAFDPVYVYVYRTYDNGASSSREPNGYRIVQFPSNAVNVQVMTQTCATPDVTVTLPDVAANQFKSIGDVKGLKAFNLNFNNCPSGLDGINYKFGATTNVLNAANGVVALDDSATAKGVGVLLRSQTGTAIELNKEYTMSGYNTASVQNYTVPMQAGIYQTANTVESGTVKGGFTFTLIYK
ncbi:fimbrial protein [Yersinia pekkanenii]|nr:fimbrial protein [Yersinia pekkanenii]